jgi:phosphoribosylformylglycinamidine synthase
MILFFKNSPREAGGDKIYAVDVATGSLSPADIERLEWLFSGARLVEGKSMEGEFIGPRREMITPWSTNAVEITQNMGIAGIRRIEEFAGGPTADSAARNTPAEATDETPGEPLGVSFDPMLNNLYRGLDQDVFTVTRSPEPIREIRDIAAYNRAEGLALSDDEVAYLEQVGAKMGRPLTDSEVFGFSQVNSEHCRHKFSTESS